MKKLCRMEFFFFFLFFFSFGRTIRSESKNNENDLKRPRDWRHILGNRRDGFASIDTLYVARVEIVNGQNRDMSIRWKEKESLYERVWDV